MNNAAPFKYPNTTGISFSFTDDGYFEEAQYRFLGNGQFRIHPFCLLPPPSISPRTVSHEHALMLYIPLASSPQCAKAVVIWQHGRYFLNANGSITMDPSIFVADGRVQVQDPCAATTKILTYYSQFSLFNGWGITIDRHHRAYMLQLTRFDGSLFPRFVHHSSFPSRFSLI